MTPYDADRIMSRQRDALAQERNLLRAIEAMKQAGPSAYLAVQALGKTTMIELTGDQATKVLTALNKANKAELKAVAAIIATWTEPAA